MVELHGIEPPLDQFAGLLDAIPIAINDEWPAILREGVAPVLDFEFSSRVQCDDVRMRAQSMGAHC